MAGALLSTDENTVLIFVGQIMSELLNNAALISSHVLGVTSPVPFFIQHRVFFIGVTETEEDIASCVYRCFRSTSTPPWVCGKEGK